MSVLRYATALVLAAWLGGCASSVTARDAAVDTSTVVMRFDAITPEAAVDTHRIEIAAAETAARDAIEAIDVPPPIEAAVDTAPEIAAAETAVDAPEPVGDVACNLTGRWSYRTGDGIDGGLWLPTDLVERDSTVAGYFPSLGNGVGPHTGAAVRIVLCCGRVLSADIDPSCSRMTGLYLYPGGSFSFDAVRGDTIDAAVSEAGTD